MPIFLPASLSSVKKVIYSERKHSLVVLMNTALPSSITQKRGPLFSNEFIYLLQWKKPGWQVRRHGGGEDRLRLKMIGGLWPEVNPDHLKHQIPYSSLKGTPQRRLLWLQWARPGNPVTSHVGWTHFQRKKWVNCSEQNLNSSLYTGKL